MYMGFKEHENLVSTLGKWAWIIGIINGLIYIIYGLWALYWYSVASSTATAFGVTAYMANDLAYLSATAIWYIIAGLITIGISIIFIRPRFSVKCAAKDWNYLLNDVLVLGSTRIPWMLIWGIIMEILGQWWGGLPILIPAFILIFAGPKEYQWKVKAKPAKKEAEKPVKKETKEPVKKEPEKPVKKAPKKAPKKTPTEE